MGYNEFLCAESFAPELLEGGMRRVNGVDVFVHVVDRYPHLGAVQLRATPRSSVSTAVEDALEVRVVAA